MKRLHAVSLFSNCGAGDVGFSKAGFEFAVMAELEPHRLEVCKLNHPRATGVVGDLRETWKTVVKEYRRKAGTESPSLLCACPPCQGMSSARSGKGKHSDAIAGSKDQRNLLVTVVANVALELLPKTIVVENVSAFLTRVIPHPKTKKPISAANFLIETLGVYYEHFAIVSDLADFGIPQSRVRSFITFIRKDIAGLKRLRQSNLAPFPSPLPSGQPKRTISETLLEANIPWLDARSKENSSAAEFHPLHFVPVWQPRMYEMVAAIPVGTGCSAWNNNVCPSCGSQCTDPESAICTKCSALLLRPAIKGSNGDYRLIKGFASSYRRMHADRPAATITTASGHASSDYTIHPTENRVLSALECSILQTFPEDFAWGDTLKKYGPTNIREMIGEAVPPAFTEAHGKVLKAILLDRKINAMQASDFRVTKAKQKLSLRLVHTSKNHSPEAESAPPISASAI